MRLPLLAILLAVFASAPRAASAGDLSLIDFQGGFLAGFQNGGTSLTGQVAWTPEYTLTPALGLKGKFGWALMAASPSGTFSALDYEALFGWQFLGPLAVYIGGGATTWISNGGTASIFTAEVLFRPAGKIFGLVDRLYVSYSLAPFTLAVCHEFVAGVGFRF